MNCASVNRIRLRLTTDDHHAASVQTRCSRWFHARFQHELAGVLTQVAEAQDADCIIDNLTLTLDEIPLARFEESMSQQLLAHLKQALLACRWHRDEEGRLRGSLPAPAGHGTGTGQGTGAGQGTGTGRGTRAGQGSEAGHGTGTGLGTRAGRGAGTGQEPGAGGAATSRVHARTVSSARQDAGPSGPHRQRPVSRPATLAGSPRDALPSLQPGAGPADPVRRAALRFGQLLRYLDTGIVADARPWSRRAAREAWFTGTLAQAARMPDGLTPQAAMALRVLEPRAWQRLVTTWSGDALATLTHWLTSPGSQPCLPGSDHTGLPAPPSDRVQHYVPLAALRALQHHPQAWERAAKSHLLVALPDRLRALSRTEEGFGHGPDTLVYESGPASGKSLFSFWREALLQAPLPAPLQAALQSESVRSETGSSLLQPVPPGTTPVPVNGARLQTASPQSETPDPPPVPFRHKLPPENRQAAREQARRTDPPARPAVSPEPDNKLPQPQPQPQPQPDALWGIPGAGLVLLWPLLPRLFISAGWVEDGRFVNEEARWQALAALDWLVWGDAELAEWRVPCARLLCNIDPALPFAAGPVSTEQQERLDTWFRQVFGSVPMLGRCEPQTLRELFLQRAGTLDTENRTVITVESHAADALLLDLPWPLSPVVLPWRDTLISVEWKQ